MNFKKNSGNILGTGQTIINNKSNKCDSGSNPDRCSAKCWFGLWLEVSAFGTAHLQFWLGNPGQVLKWALNELNQVLKLWAILTTPICSKQIKVPKPMLYNGVQM
jgi:hypothetical protein